MTTLTVYEGGKTGHLTSSATVSDWLTIMNDSSYDQLRLSAGTYTIDGANGIAFDTNRTKMLTIAPELGAEGKVIIKQGTAPWFLQFGWNSQAGNLTFKNLTFDTWSIGSTGLFMLYYGHDIYADHILVQNVVGTVTEESWVWYLSSNASYGVTNSAADYFTVHGAVGRTLGAVQSEHNPNCRGTNYLRYWAVDYLNYAFYSGTSDGQGVVMDGWTIDHCSDGHGTPRCVYFQLPTGYGSTIKNCTATNSGGASIRTGDDGGGNSWS